MKYIAFLRAINVGGHTVKMEYLRSLFSELGFANVRTYIQTGNVFFETSEGNREVLTRQIEQHLQKTLGYEVMTAIRTISEVEKIFELEPFQQVEVTPDVRLCILFLSQSLPESIQLPFISERNEYEICSATSSEAFVVLRIVQEGRVGNVNAFLEKKYGIKSTVRFYGTTAKILEAAKAS